MFFFHAVQNQNDIYMQKTMKHFFKIVLVTVAHANDWYSLIFVVSIFLDLNLMSFW